MNTTIPSGLTHIVILDISGVYAQIHNQGYFDKDFVDDIRKQYIDERHWMVLIIE